MKLSSFCLGFCFIVFTVTSTFGNFQYFQTPCHLDKFSLINTCDDFQKPLNANSDLPKGENLLEQEVEEDFSIDEDYILLAESILNKEVLSFQVYFPGLLLPGYISQVLYPPENS